MDRIRYAAFDLEGDEGMLVPESGRPSYRTQDQENTRQHSLEVGHPGSLVGLSLLIATTYYVLLVYYYYYYYYDYN